MLCECARAALYGVCRGWWWWVSLPFALGST